MPNSLVRRLAPYTFTLGAATGALGLIGLILFALYDSVSSAKSSQVQVQSSALSAELSNFLLAAREPDGSSLLENPIDFGRSERKLGFVQLKRSFYSYLLNRGNARTFSVDKVTWEPSRPCVLQYPIGDSTSSSIEGVALANVQVCFAVVPSEQSSRYAYFSIRYPSSHIRQHSPGMSLSTVDRVVLNFEGERSASVVLAFAKPSLAASRYPSQLARFAGLHEISAFASNNSERVLHHVNAQAFEQPGEGDDARTYITIVGRIDAGLLDPHTVTSSQWPTSEIRSVRIGIDLYGRNVGPSGHYRIEPDTKGHALVSLQNTYLSSVPSRSRLTVSRTRGSMQTTIWSSTDLQIPEPPRIEDWRQKVSDWWAPRLMQLFSYKPESVESTLHHRVSGPNGDLTATLRSPALLLPGVTTRAFLWLTTALVVAGLLMFLLLWAVIRIRSVTHLAWAMTSGNAPRFKRKAFTRRRNEFATLSRVLISLYTRNATLNVLRLRRIKWEAAQKAKEMRLLQTHLELRHERLAAIGHEIRSPLASLIAREHQDEYVQKTLLRISTAVDKIQDAASAAEGISNQTVITGPIDLAAFLARLVENESMPGLRYEGPSSGVRCEIDDFLFENVIHHVIDNASRYRTSGTDIVVQLRKNKEQGDAVVSVMNSGPRIPESNLRTIFEYGNGDRSTPQNQGIGLYSSRSYLLGMKATISAENLGEGVAFVILIPLSAS